MTHRIPVIVWRDALGAYTARTLDGPHAAAVDLTQAAALQQLKLHLTELFRRGEGTPADLREEELREHSVEVRPEYRERDSVYPVGAKVTLRVVAVHGRRRDGTGVCVFPTLDQRFAHQKGDPVQELIADTLTQALGRQMPLQLALQLIPNQIVLTAVHVRDRLRFNGADERVPRSLRQTCDRLGERRRGLRVPRGIGRDGLVATITSRLQTNSGSLLILGEAGVGKSTLIAEAALRLRRAAKDEPTVRQPKLWRTSARRLIAGMQYLGQWQERLEQIIADLAEGADILCVENLLDLVRTGGCDAAASIAAFLAPYIERGELRMLAEVNPRELDACRRLLPAFADLFEIVRAPDFTPAESRDVLTQVLSSAAQGQGVTLEPGLAELILRLFRRFAPYVQFPGKIVEFSRRLLHERGTAGATHVRTGDVLARFREDTGLPEVLLRDELPLPHPQVLAYFESRILGQPEACRAAAEIVTLVKTGLNDLRRPLGVLLFCGPTGVGKTELAKALGDYLFGQRAAADRVVRLDMSEYAGFGSAERLTTGSDGEVSQFVRRMRRQPFAVVLLDEIEKAAPEVHDAILGLLDEGRLTDRFGRTTSFQSAVIILTSNVGADRRTGVGFDPSAPASEERIVLSEFRPEFVNRLDAIVPFRPLTADVIRQLAQRELEAVARREGLTKARLRLTWTDDVLMHLAAVGCDLRYGARPLQRVVEREVVSTLAEWRVENLDLQNARVMLNMREGKVVAGATPEPAANT